MNNATMWGIWIVVDLSRTSRIWYIHFLFEVTLELCLICQEFVYILFKSEVYGLLDHDEMCSLICCSVYDSTSLIMVSGNFVATRLCSYVRAWACGDKSRVHKTD